MRAAEVAEKAENCKKAIVAFGEALNVRTLEHFPMQYAMTNSDLGSAYRILAEVEGKVENCGKAIAAYEEALNVRTLDRFPIGYAMTQNNIAVAYLTLAQVEEKQQNIVRAGRAFTKALKGFENGGLPDKAEEMKKNLKH